MKPLRWTIHALVALADRDIDRAAAERTIANPERSVTDLPHRTILMRHYFDAQLGREMLLRVVIEDTPEERVVVTVYKTSRIARYLTRVLP